VISGIQATKNSEGLGWLHGGMIGLIYVAILIIISLFTMPSISFGLGSLIDLALGFIVGTIAGVLGVNYWE